MKNIRKSIFLAIAVLFALPLFNACKKGDKDPFLSIYTRKARLVGEWDMTNGQIVTKDNDGTSTTTFNNGTFTNTYGGWSYSGTYTYTTAINKNGTYKSSQTETYYGHTDTFDDEGVWYFLCKNKEEGLKNKEAVAFQSKIRTYSYSSGTPTTYTEMGDDLVVYLITQLKNKEIILEKDYSYTEPSGSETQQEEYTFTLK